METRIPGTSPAAGTPATAEAHPKGSWLTTDRAAGVLVVGSVLWLAFVRKAFSSVLVGR